MSAVTEYENQQGNGNKWGDEDDRQWNSEWIGSLDDWSGDSSTDDELVPWIVFVDWRTEFRSATDAYSECA